MYVFSAYNFRFLFCFKEPEKNYLQIIFMKFTPVLGGMFKYCSIKYYKVHVCTFVNTSVNLTILVCLAHFYKNIRFSVYFKLKFFLPALEEI